jgi:hypothetical protein
MDGWAMWRSNKCCRRGVTYKSCLMLVWRKYVLTSDIFWCKASIFHCLPLEDTRTILSMVAITPLIFAILVFRWVLHSFSTLSEQCCWDFSGCFIRTRCPAAAALLQEDEFCDTAKNGRDSPQLLSEWDHDTPCNSLLIKDVYHQQSWRQESRK